MEIQGPGLGPATSCFHVPGPWLFTKSAEISGALWVRLCRPFPRVPLASRNPFFHFATP